MHQSHFKKSLRNLANTAFGLRLRTFTQIRPPTAYPDLEEAVSDLFVWRCDDTWETHFDLLNLAGMLNPEFQDSYEAMVVVFNESGTMIAKRNFCLSFGEAIPIDLEREFHLRGIGTFSVFHLVENKRLFGQNSTCLSERGYTSYRQKSSPSLLRSYVHGNQYCLGYNHTTHKIRAVGAPPGSRQHAYQPQVDFRDCERFEFLFSNPCAYQIKVKIDFFEKDQEIASSFTLKIEPNGLAVFDSRLLPNVPKAVRITSKLSFLRPVIFKYYKSHFDVFHG